MGLQRRPKQHALLPASLHRDTFSYSAIPIKMTMIVPTTPINRELEFISPGSDCAVNRLAGANNFLSTKPPRTATIRDVLGTKFRVSSNEMVDIVQPHEPYHNKVDSDDVVQQLWNY
jgi:hypothetical protein